MGGSPPAGAASAASATAPAGAVHGPGAVTIVKLGGRALETPGALAECADALKAAGATPTLVVHGGGAEVSAWCARAGIEPRFADGLRVTDAATLEIATAVLAGLANKRLVAALRARDVDAVGISALDGGIVRARRHANADVLGEVGEIGSVDVALLAQLLASGRVPVLASLGDDGKGALLNLNADDVAAGIAAALPAGDLVLFSDTPGLVLDGELVRSLDAHALDGVLARPDVTGGMRPKLRAVRRALAAGVQRVAIAAWQGPDTLAGVIEGRAIATLFRATRADVPTPLTPEESHA